MISSSGGTRHVKLEIGHSLIVRFLPARIGPDGRWFACIAGHRLNGVPIVCPKLTGDDFGGDKDADCPVCLMAEELSEARDTDTSSFGRKMMANPQYLTYCILREKDGVKLPMDAVVNAREFLLEERTWAQLYGFCVASARKAPDSVLDYRKGNDFSIIRSRNGTRLDKLDSQPIFDEDDKNFTVYIKKLEAGMKNPKIQMPTIAELEAFTDKVQEEVITIQVKRSEQLHERCARAAAALKYMGIGKMSYKRRTDVSHALLRLAVDLLQPM